MPCRSGAVGWIYFAAAWLSLAVINGILAFMLTPGCWLVTRSFCVGLLNPTCFPSLAARTLAAMGLAGLYALLTASWTGDAALRRTIARYAGLGWVVPSALLLPLSILWVLGAAGGAGVPVAEILGGQGEGWGRASGSNRADRCASDSVGGWLAETQGPKAPFVAGAVLVGAMALLARLLPVRAAPMARIAHP